jgi:hypothetical protein
MQQLPHQQSQPTPDSQRVLAVEQEGRTDEATL